jgi:hypothetical protein
VPAHTPASSSSLVIGIIIIIISNTQSKRGLGLVGVHCTLLLTSSANDTAIEKIKRMSSENKGWLIGQMFLPQGTLTLIDMLD